jgi:hypothetical protein
MNKNTRQLVKYHGLFSLSTRLLLLCVEGSQNAFLDVSSKRNIYLHSFCAWSALCVKYPNCKIRFNHPSMRA